MVVLLVGSFVAFNQYRLAANSAESKIESRFLTAFDEKVDAIVAEINAYERALLATRGLFESSEKVSRKEFRIFFERLQVQEHYPGILGLGYAPIIAAGQKSLHEQRVRQSGFPNYAIYPSYERERYSTILYLEPFEGRNLRAFGYDMFSEPVRRDAMQRAVDTGRPSMSSKVLLVQDAADQPSAVGLLMYEALYRGVVGADSSEADRREAHIGWVYVVFRLNDVIHSALKDSHVFSQLKVFEGEHPAPENLLYGHNPTLVDDRSVYETIELGDKIWLFMAAPDASFIDQYQQNNPYWTLLAGVALTFLLAILSVLLVNGRSRAIALANRMTQSLTKTHRRLVLATEVAGIGIWEWHFLDNSLKLDRSLLALLGLDDREDPTIDLRTWYLLMPPESRTAFDRAVEHCTNERELLDLQLALQPRGRTPIHVQLHGEVQLDDDGEAAGILGVCYDITESWQHRQQLVETERRWKHALEGTGEGVWDWNIASGDVVFSDTLVRMLGFEPGELCPREWLKRIHPDDRQQVEQDINALLSDANSEYRNEHRLLCKDGRWKWILDRGSVIEHDLAGNPLRAVGTHIDISRQKAAEIALRQSESRFHKAFDTAATGMALVSQSSRWLEVNDTLCEMLGYSESELLRMHTQDITHLEDHELDHQLVQKIIQRELDYYQVEKSYRRKDGVLLDVKLRVSAVQSLNGEVQHFVYQIEDITQQKIEQHYIRQLAYYDVMTGLPNRRLFNERVADALDHAQMVGCQLALMIVDIDYFKQINDTHGHDIGDQVIKMVADRMLNALHANDMLARLGGDEFVVLLSEVESSDRAVETAENLRAQFDDRLKLVDCVLDVSLSIGVALYSPDRQEPLSSLMKKADIALYEVKGRGRNNVALYQSDEPSAQKIR